MTSRAFRVAAAILMCTTVVAEASAQASTSVNYNYANIAFPGATLTSANGINNSNIIVGSYLDSADYIHGFVYRQGRYTAVNFPGASATEVLGINDFGDIVGVYQVPGPLNFHGFLRHNGTFKSIDTPAAEFGTKAFGINNDGTIVGSYDDAHGFIYREGSYKTLDAPQLPGEQPNTQLNGISNLGWIVGQVLTGGIWRGFWIVSEDFDFLEPPGYADSQVTGVNGRGDIVGCHEQRKLREISCTTPTGLLCLGYQLRPRCCGELLHRQPAPSIFGSARTHASCHKPGKPLVTYQSSTSGGHRLG